MASLTEFEACAGRISALVANLLICEGEDPILDFGLVIVEPSYMVSGLLVDDTYPVIDIIVIRGGYQR